MADALNSKLTLVIADLQMQLKRAEKEVRSWKATAEKSGEGIEEKLLGERKNYLKIIDGLRRDMAVLRKEARQGVELKADVSNYIKQLERAHREIDGLKVAQEDLVKSDRLRNLSMNERGKTTRKSGGGVADTALGVGLAGAGLFAMDRLSGMAIRLAGSVKESVVEIDSLERSLLAVEGSGFAASRRLEELEKMARKPGLGFSQTVSGYVRLRSVGMSANDAKDALAEMGNALAAVGGSAADLDGVVLALTQIISKGKVSAEEINQIAERVPQVRAVMQNVFGTADTEVLQKMNLTAEEFVNKLVDGFGSQIPRAADSLQNKLDNVSDTWTRIGDTIGRDIVSDTIPAMEKLSDAVLNVSKMLALGFKDVNSFLKLTGVEPGALFKRAAEDIRKFEEVQKRVNQTLESQALAKRSIDMANAMNDPNLSDQQRVKMMQEWTQKTVPAKPKPAGMELPKTKAETEAEKQAQKELNELLKEGAAINEQLAGVARQRLDMAMAQMKPEEQLKQIQKEIADRQSLIDSGMLNQTTRLDVESQVLSLKMQELRTQQQIADEEERAKREQEAKNKDAASRSLALAEYKEELRIQELINQGKTKQAEAAQRDLDIQREKRQLMEQMKISEEEALRLATQRVDLERQGQNSGNGRYDSEGRRNDGRKRIVSHRDGSTKAPESPGNRSGLDQFYERNKRGRLNEEFQTPSLDAYDQMQQTPLRDTFQFPGLDGYNEMQNRSQENAARQDSAGQRSGAVAEQAASMVIENLPQILQALTTA